MNNLQRFTEIQFENKPYPIRKYNQTGLVKSNNYQAAQTEELMDIWTALNNRIRNIIKQQNEETLSYSIELEKDTFSDLRFLISDYVDHLEHHLHQILSENQ